MKANNDILHGEAKTGVYQSGKLLTKFIKAYEMMIPMWGFRSKTSDGHAKMESCFPAERTGFLRDKLGPHLTSGLAAKR